MHEMFHASASTRACNKPIAGQLKRCRLAQLCHDLRNIELLTALSFLNAVFNGAQPPVVVVRHQRLWSTALTDAHVLCSANRTVRRADAFVTVLPHDGVQLARTG